MKKILKIRYEHSDINKLADLLVPFLLKNNPVFVGLKGGLGAGKTSLTRALVNALGSADLVSSPTYTLENQYKAIKREKSLLIRHWDLYRLEESDEAIDQILEVTIDASKGKKHEIILLEWYEKCPDLLRYINFVIDLDFDASSEEGRYLELFLGDTIDSEQDFIAEIEQIEASFQEK